MAKLLLGKEVNASINEEIKAKVIELIEENKQRYGYRRINALLRKENIIVSEKIVLKIMKDNSLTVQVRRRRKYSSHTRENIERHFI